MASFDVYFLAMMAADCNGLANLMISEPRAFTVEVGGGIATLTIAVLCFPVYIQYVW